MIGSFKVCKGIVGLVVEITLAGGTGGAAGMVLVVVLITAV